MMETASAQDNKSLFDRLSREQTLPALEELRSFIGLPNDATRQDDIKVNAGWLLTAFSKRNFKFQSLETGYSPLVFAERKTPGAISTVLFYFHYDGQPVDAAQWSQPNPYGMVLKEKGADGRWKEIPPTRLSGLIDPEWRVFGRSVADDKGSIIMFLAALDALEARKMKPAFNIEVVLDGEEEKGSDHLASTLEKYRDLFKAERLLVIDGPVHLSGKPTIIYGVRGAFVVNLTVYGPKLPLHSGHYGNYAPNPIFRMAKLIAGMKDESGRVTIPGYYDGVVLDKATRKILSEVPDDPAQLGVTFGIPEPEKVGANLQEALQYPTLNVRGLVSGHVGKEAANVIPTLATASIDIRLVPETPAERLAGLIRKYIENQGYHVLDRDPLPAEYLQFPLICKMETQEATLPFRTPFDSPTGKWVENAFRNSLGESPVRIRTMGATLPIIHFIHVLKIPTVIVPMVNADNNQHGEDENLRIGNLTSGIRTFLAILHEKPVN